MRAVVAELGGLPLYAWAFAAYMLATTVTVPIWGKLADLRGRKPVLLAGVALFLGGSFACGHAHSMGALIAWRAVQGLGAGAMQPVTFTIVGDLFDVHERGRMQGLFGAVWGLAGLVGPLVGGAIVNSVGWRWIFWVNLPFGIASAAVLVVAYHERPERHAHRLDVLGAALLSVSVVAALLAVRSRGAGLVALPVALAATAAFLLVERRAKEPLLPLDLFGQRVIAVSSAAGALMGAAMLSTVTYVPLWVQSVLGLPPTSAGAAIAPMALGWPVASAISGRLIPRLGYRRLLLTGFATSAGAALLLPLALRPGAHGGRGVGHALWHHCLPLPALARRGVGPQPLCISQQSLCHPGGRCPDRRCHPGGKAPQLGPRPRRRQPARPRSCPRQTRS